MVQHRNFGSEKREFGTCEKGRGRKEPELISNSSKERRPDMFFGNVDIGFPTKRSRLSFASRVRESGRTVMGLCPKLSSRSFVRVCMLLGMLESWLFFKPNTSNCLRSGMSPQFVSAFCSRFRSRRFLSGASEGRPARAGCWRSLLPSPAHPKAGELDAGNSRRRG